MLDITARRETESKLMDYTTAIAERNQQLAAINKELDDFVHIASHDLREPLRNLLAFVDMLPDDLGQDLPEDAAKDLRFIKPESHAAFADIVLGGKFKDKGMVPFTGQLSAEQVDQIHSFIIDRGQQDWRGGFGPPPPPPAQR